MTATIVLILFALLFIGALPLWPYSKNWGYKASGIVIVLMLFALIGIFLGRI